MYSLAVSIVCVILICGARSNSVQSQSDFLTEVELTHITAVRALIATYGNTIWSGWGDDIPPFLISSGEIDLLIGHPSPPEDFELIPDFLIDGESVFWLDGHLLPQPVASAWLVGEEWVVAVPTQDDLQALLDAYLGTDVIDLTDAEYIRTLVHEAFHVYQFITLGGPENIPLFGMEADDPPRLDTLLEDELLLLNSQHRTEGEALHAALEAETIDQQLEFAIEFLDLREARRAIFQDTIIPYEQNVEWVEGTARYVDVMMMLTVGEQTYTATIENAPINYLPADTLWNDFLNQLSDPASIPGTLRDRYYVFGAGICFLLDELMPQWKTRFFMEEIALETLLIDAITDAQ